MLKLLSRLLSRRGNGRGQAALTYANDVLTDGAGAQLQRIYGIYALSRALGLPYVHTPLKRVGYQGLAALESNSESQEIQDRYNSICRIPSDMEIKNTAIVEYIKKPSRHDIGNIINKCHADGQFRVIKILFPYEILDREPDLYRYASEISPFSKRNGSDVFRIAIHVRRGDLAVVDSDRALPNSYYTKIVKQLCGILSEMNVDFSCDLYTEMPTKTFRVTPEHLGMVGRLDKPMDINPSHNSIEDFDTLPNLRKFINLDQIQTLAGMATADALVLSRSSFSYLAAIFNREAAILYHPFWHAPLSHWLVTEKDTFSHASMRRHIERYKAARDGRTGERRVARM